MIRTMRGYINPMAWAIMGWALAILGNLLGKGLGARYPVLIHCDELLVGFGFGVLRWLHGEWQIEHIHESRAMELKIRNALQVLYHGDNPVVRRDALRDVLEAFEKHRPVHGDFRMDVEDFLLRQDKVRQKYGPNINEK